MPPSEQPNSTLVLPLLSAPSSKDSPHKCTSNHHEPGKCHGFDLHKASSGWVDAGHGDFNIKVACGSDESPEKTRRKKEKQILAVSAGVMSLVMILELTCGFYIDSLALLSDGTHYASDVAMYLWLLMAVSLSDQKHDVTAYSFGYHRAEVLGGLVALLLQYFAIALLLVSAVTRLTVEPRHVYGPTVCAVGAVSLAANAALLYFAPGSSGHGHSHGGGGGGDAVSIARLHMLGDLVQGSAVIITGLISWISPECTWADPSSTFVYACVVLGTSWRVFQDLLATLMERAPLEVDVQGLFDDIQKIKGVIDVHCCHVWALAPEKVAMSAHLHIEDDMHEEVLHAAQIVVKHKYGIAHSTLQISEDEDLA